MVERAVIDQNHDTSMEMLPWTLIIVLVLVGLWLQSLTVLNHDVGWVLYSSGRLLNGGTFGKDVIDPNPPLIWWISALPLSISRAYSADPILVYRLFMATAALFSMGAANGLLRPYFGPGVRAIIVTLIAFYFFLGVHRDFGQREHLTVILALPYLVLAAWRLDGREVNPVIGVLAGMAAAAGFSFKLPLGAVPLIIEVALIVRRRSFSSVYRPEALAAIAMVVVYFAAIIYFAKPYWGDFAPAIARTYWGFSYPVEAVVAHYKWTLAAVVLAVGLCAWSRWPAIPTVFAFAAVGFAVSGVVQSKGYSYHFYPVSFCIALAFATLLMADRWQRVVAAVGLVLFAGAGVVQTYWQFHYRTFDGRYGRNVVTMANFVADIVPRDGMFMALSTHPYPGFPTTFYAERHWAPVTNSRIFLPSIVRMREAGTPESDETLQFAVAREQGMALRDLSRAPALVLIDIRPVRHAIDHSEFDILSFYLEDQAFANLWETYTEHPDPPEGFRAFVRSGS
jgi:hypothetical protein